VRFSAEELLLLRRSEPDARAVLEDVLLAEGRAIKDQLRYLRFYDYGYGGDDGSSGGGYGGGGYGGDGDDGSSGGGYGGGYDGDDGSSGGGYGGGYGGEFDKTSERGHVDMEEGLKVVSVISGYVPYVFVGWLRRIDGDEYELVNARVIRRFGDGYSIAELALKGPKLGPGATQLLPPATETVHRLMMSRCIAANVEAWKAACPAPAP
jgi:hypothetical protein